MGTRIPKAWAVNGRIAAVVTATTVWTAVRRWKRHCTGFGQGIASFEPGARPRHYAYVIGANHWAFCEGGPLGPSTITPA